jgi:hypothetical protein
MKKLSDYIDPTLWLLAILALAAVYLLVQLNDTSTAFHRANVQAAQQYEKLSNQSIEKERSLREEIDLLAIQHRKEKQDDQIKNEAAIAALRAGTQRVSVAVRACSPAASSTDPPLPAEIQVREPNLRQRLQQIWQTSPPTATPPSKT